MSKPASSVPSFDDSLKKREPDTDVEQGPITEKDPEGNPAVSAPEQVNPWHPSQFPDGGKDAWLCLLGAACCLFCSFGWLNCIGVFQNYYQTHQLSSYSPSTVAWISSCEIFVMFFPGPIIGFFYDNHGPKYLLLFGTFFHVFGIMMTSLCKEYWQFILAQGICSPLGLNAIFNAGTSTITTWFFKKRGAAYGIMAAGSGLGGILFPIMASHLIPEVGFGWAMRICAFLILGLLLVAMLTVKSRLPPKPRAFELKVFWEPFLDTRFNLVTISSFLFFMGLFIPINFIEVQAAASGMSTRLAGYLISILNAARYATPSILAHRNAQLLMFHSIFGRIIPGILADKFGRFNMQLFMSFFAGIIVLALALPASSNAAFIVFAILYGFASGAYVSLAPAQIAYISKVEQIGVRMGVLFSVVSFAGLAGNPIAGQIVKSSMDGLNIFAGVLLLSGAISFTITRMYCAEWKIWIKI